MSTSRTPRVPKVGDAVRFDSSALTGLDIHNVPEDHPWRQYQGHVVVVIRCPPPGLRHGLPYYKVRAADGWTQEVWANELVWLDGTPVYRHGPRDQDNEGDV